MATDERVDVLDRLTLHDPASSSLARVLGLGDTGVQNLETLEILPEQGRKMLVRSSLVGEASVPAAGRTVEEEQCGQARRLFLVSDLYVASDGSEVRQL